LKKLVFNKVKKSLVHPKNEEGKEEEENKSFISVFLLNRILDKEKKGPTPHR